MHPNTSDSITLIIRAPHYQIPDFSVQCCTNWSVRNLKEHLSEVYPNQPVSISFTLLNKLL